MNSFRSNNPPIWATLAALALGIVVGFAVGSGLPREAEPIEQAPSVRAALPGGEGVSEPRKGPLPAPAADRQDLAPTDGTPTDSMSTAMLTVRGRVVDLGGTGIGGATIAVAGNLRAATADASGEFELPAPAEGRTTVTALAEGWSITSGVAEAGRELVLVGRRVFNLDLDLRLPDGRAPTAATLELASESLAKLDSAPDRTGGTPYLDPARIDRSVSLPWTPQRSTLRTRSGRITGRAVLMSTGPEGPIVYRSETFSFDALIDGDGPHRVELEPKASVAFTFGAATDQASFVSIVRASDTSGRTLEVQNVLGRPVPQRTDGYSIDGIQPGNWIAVFGRADGVPVVGQPFTLRPGSQTVELALPDPEGAELLEVEVFRDGQLVRGPVRFASGRVGDLEGEGAEEGVQGRRQIAWAAVLGDSPMPAERTEVEITCRVPGLGDRTLSVDLDARRVRFDFESPGSIRIFGLESQARAFDAFVRPLRTEDDAELVDEYGRITTQARIAAGEAGKVNGLQPGTYLVTVRDSSGDEGVEQEPANFRSKPLVSAPFVDRQTVVVEPGENFVTMQVLPRFAPEIEYSNLENPKLIITPEGQGPGKPGYYRHVIRGQNGRASCPPLVAGRYRMWTYNGGNPVEDIFDVPSRIVRIDGATSASGRR